MHDVKAITSFQRRPAGLKPTPTCTPSVVKHCCPAPFLHSSCADGLAVSFPTAPCGHSCKVSIKPTLSKDFRLGKDHPAMCSRTRNSPEAHPHLRQCTSVWLNPTANMEDRKAQILKQNFQEPANDAPSTSEVGRERHVLGNPAVNF